MAYAAAATCAGSSDFRLSVLDPATDRPWQLVNAADAAPHMLTTLKIAR